MYINNNYLSVSDYVERAQTADFETAVHYAGKFFNFLSE